MAIEKQHAGSPLDLTDIPSPDADWSEISTFALRFNAYDRHGSLEAVAKIANERNPQTLYELLTCLFFEQRRWRHFQELPHGEALEYIRSLVRRIRDRAAELDPHQRPPANRAR